MWKYDFNIYLFYYFFCFFKRRAQSSFPHPSGLYLSCERLPRTQVCVWQTPLSLAACCPLAGSRTPPVYGPPSLHSHHLPKRKNTQRQNETCQHKRNLVFFFFQCCWHSHQILVNQGGILHMIKLHTQIVFCKLCIFFIEQYQYQFKNTYIFIY